MQRIQPEIVITFGPDGFTGHSDHVAIGQATTMAFNRFNANDSKKRKLYYTTVPESIVPNADEYGITTRPDEEITITIDISSFLDTKIQAVATHRSQEDSRQFAEMLRQDRDLPFTTKEFLYLANSEHPIKETSLF
jgi:LmbE family N-acetylglucosaminyl deacetylase